jgi:hypothetical protein
MRDKMPAANAVLTAYYRDKIRDTRGETVRLRGINQYIRNNLLWLGLQQKTLQRKILSCAIIDIRYGIPSPGANDLPLPVTFDDADAIENIRVDINNPEVVIVFGKFKATIVDGGDPTNPNRRPDKIIHNVMVIYTNLQNDAQNDRNYGAPVAGYALGYDNFKELTINEDPVFKGFYSCVDGLVAASTDKGAMQQNIGVLMVKKTKTSGFSVVGFHNGKLTAISEQSTSEKEKEQANLSNVLCYDYNMCADSLKIAYDDFSRPRVDPTMKTETGVFNPMTFYAFYIANKNEGGQMKPFTDLFKGVYALIDTKSSTQDTKTPTKLHILNTWGIDLSSNKTMFYRRLYELNKNSTVRKFNIKMYEKYMNDIIDTILSSAKAYYEEKIKTTFYEYGTIDGNGNPNPPILFRRDSGGRNVVVGGALGGGALGGGAVVGGTLGGGKKEDAKLMLLATEYALDNEAKTSTKNQVTFKKVIEIRIPDIMMSDEYLSEITEPDRKNVRIVFVNSIYKYF